MFSAFDKDGSGVIDFDEFLIALRVSYMYKVLLIEMEGHQFRNCVHALRTRTVYTVYHYMYFVFVRPDSNLRVNLT